MYFLHIVHVQGGSDFMPNWFVDKLHINRFEEKLN